jgi:uncharacterized DUF497 family protein
MSDFDPVKEASNLSKHGISLARWINIDMKITFVDSRHDYGEIRYRGYGYIDGLAYCLVLPNAMDGCGRSACDARTTRK